MNINQTENIKKYFLVTVVVLLVCGLIMVYSASYIYAKEKFGSSMHFFYKQLFFIILGSFMALVVSKTKLSFWYKYSAFLNFTCCFLLFLTFTPLGLSIKGSQRWLDLGGLNIQPGELVKYTVALYGINYFNNFNQKILKQKIIESLHFFIPLLMFVLQPDFGTLVVSIILIFFTAYLSNIKRKFLVVSGAVVTLITSIIMISAPYRVKRLLTFLNPWDDPQNSGFQIIQSFLAFANGHIWGQGIGNSNEKLFYLPEAYNDFIFSVIGEELGFVGVVFIVLLFLSFSYLGFKLALNSFSNINKQVILVFVFGVSFQAAINMCVVLGLVPTKGLNLPFISYGGSSLITNLLIVGLIMSAITKKSQVKDEVIYV